MESLKEKAAISNATNVDMKAVYETFDILDSTCEFIKSAIDRSLVFAKTNDSSAGLKPFNNCIDLMATLRNPIRWMSVMLPPTGFYLCAIV